MIFQIYKCEAPICNSGSDCIREYTNRGTCKSGSSIDYSRGYVLGVCKGEYPQNYHKKLDVFSHNDLSFIIAILSGNQTKIKEWLETLHGDIMHTYELYICFFNFTRNQM